MCTLILARDVLGPRTVILGANRDERVARPSAPPDVLAAAPRVAGGRDRVAGGTWLAVREGAAAVALLNRRDRGAQDSPTERRSRGLLTLDVARVAVDRTSASAAVHDAAEDDLARAALEEALRSIARHRYAPFTLLYASPTSCWSVALQDSHPVVSRIGPGWHVVTHRDLDDPSEPRTARLMTALGRQQPVTPGDAEVALLAGLLSLHGEEGAPVCLHEGVMVTVSSSIVKMDASGARYWHAEGRPCEHAYEDRTSLITGSEGGRITP